MIKIFSECSIVFSNGFSTLLICLLVGIWENEGFVKLWCQRFLMSMKKKNLLVFKLCTGNLLTWTVLSLLCVMNKSEAFPSPSHNFFLVLLKSVIETCVTLTTTLNAIKEFNSSPLYTFWKEESKYKNYNT